MEKRQLILEEKVFYHDKQSTSFLIKDDTFKFLREMKKESIDMIFADPPYFLSNDGISCSGGKVVSVNKGDWDKVDSFEEKHEFNREWIKLDRETKIPAESAASIHSLIGLSVLYEAG